MRVDRLCNSNLNAKNLFKAINKHSISLINYHIGLQHLEPADFAAIDQEVCLFLIKHNVHLKPGCKERLYLPRKEMESGFHSVEMKSECMLLELWKTLEKYINISSRRAAILKVEEQEKTHLSLIKHYLRLRYSLEDVSVKSVINAQRDSLYGKINDKKLHEKLYRARLNEHINLKDSSTWMIHGNNNPRAEALYCYIQDRNVFWRETAPSCQHCSQAKKIIDHLATGCDRILGHNYTRRHNEVLRCIHLLLMNKYGFKKNKEIQKPLSPELVENDLAEIRVDTRIRTDILVKHNRPNIFIYDKRENMVILVEIGITGQDNLQQVEVEKKRKYDLLASELGILYKAKTKITPYVLTWESVLTKYHRSYLKELRFTPQIEAYIQSTVLKKTLETISLEHRRSIEDRLEATDVVEKAVDALMKASETGCLPQVKGK
ncbi:hypothetical protein TCON_2125 [Astathelohania contejeani]|uniref:Reverse transcriptase n=1 Tax=Astathelohania contejeani TaxID=164912 RepID=A0ABQ7HX01_9MICR|nr:hypothetical protein TCON_2125 [Thelohania contejeani]